jgi:hypothetical protein
MTPTDDLYRVFVIFVVKYMAAGFAIYGLASVAIKLIRRLSEHGVRALRVGAGAEKTERNNCAEVRFEQ